MDIRPVARVIPQGEPAFGTASGIGLLFLDRSLIHLGIGPNRLAFIANDASNELVRCGAYSYTAQTFSANRTSSHVNQIR